MPVMDSYTPGSFCWVELATHDSQEAKRFYTALFAWSATDNPVGPDQFYTILRLQDKDAAALYQMGSEQQSAGAPPSWLSYVSVASADAAVAKAGELGAKILKPPFDVMKAGRMAVLEDPTGAAFALWQPGTHPGAGLVNDPGSWCWNELATRDTDRAGDFYSGLFGWDKMVRDMGPMRYTTFSLGGRPAGGMFQQPQEQSRMPASWQVDFAVADCDASAAKVTELGGSVLMPPAEIPGVGRFAVVADPQGAIFGIINLTPPVV